jgi:hypothetical protein
MLRLALMTLQRDNLERFKLLRTGRRGSLVFLRVPWHVDQ